MDAAQAQQGLRVARDAKVQEKSRCGWVPPDDPLYLAYHDTEWGVPLHDDKRLFEFLVLEGMQAGLSWGTILKKRENFRRAFEGFDPEQIARYDGRKVRRLLSDPGIVRNRLKVWAAVTNARAFLSVQREFGSFDSYIWRFAGGRPRVNRWHSLNQIPAKTREAEEMSRDLLSRGFKFVGPTICYAHMQATGMVNDHVTTCFRYGELKT
ncbi:MAG TPA: DNA-3-methyladenine glycosylase I [Nitrososphaerales archaeon]|nr:DNA-3-methyladenine glycosylase I [Nitrososphaerales archaeon]